jgi:hypothetical protein
MLKKGLLSNLRSPFFIENILAYMGLANLIPF